MRQGFESYQTDYEQGHLFEHNTSNGYSYKIWLSVREHQFVVDGELRTDWLIFVKSEAKQAKEDGMLRQQKERFEKGLRHIDASLRLPKGHKSIPQVQQRIGALKARNQSIHAAFDLQLEDDGTKVSKIK